MFWGLEKMLFKIEIFEYIYCKVMWILWSVYYYQYIWCTVLQGNVDTVERVLLPIYICTVLQGNLDTVEHVLLTIYTYLCTVLQGNVDTVERVLLTIYIYIYIFPFLTSHFLLKKNYTKHNVLRLSWRSSVVTIL